MARKKKEDINSDSLKARLTDSNAKDMPAIDQPITEMLEINYMPYAMSVIVSRAIPEIEKKVGEETTEVIIAAKDKDKKNTIYEIADLTYHVMVLMIEAGISLDDIHKELASRHIIDHKVKQEKMTK